MNYSHLDNKTILEQSRKKLVAFLKSRKMRQTPERFALLEHVMAQNTHFSADDFHRQLESDGNFHVSKATVYNTLQVFLEAGIVRRHNFEGPAEYERIDPDGHNHHHIVCTHCGAVREVRDDEIANIISRYRYPDFEPAYFSLYVYGICAQCRRRNNHR